MQSAELTAKTHRPEILPALHVLHTAAASTPGGLQTDGVWRLARSQAARLEEDHDTTTPPGGWPALASLAVGTGILKAREDAFIPGITHPDELGDDEDTRRALLESFTRFLIPPSVAAGLFLTLDIHPLWGLRLARGIHAATDFNEEADAWTDEELLPHTDLMHLGRTVHEVVADLSSFLTESRSLTVSDITAFIGELANSHSEQLADTISGDGVAMLVESTNGTNQRGGEFFARELVNDVLIPAGVARRINDTLHLDTDLLASAEVAIDIVAENDALGE